MFGLIKDLGINVVPIFGMTFAAFVIYLGYKGKQEKSKEKIALIEKGIDPSLLNAKPKNQESGLKIGLILVSIAVGILVGYMLNSLLFVPNFVAYSTSILILCGMVLIYMHKSKLE